VVFIYIVLGWVISMKKSCKFLIQYKEIPNSVIGDLGLDVYCNLPPKCIIGKGYEIFSDGDHFIVIDEDGEENINVFGWMAQEIDNRCSICSLGDGKYKYIDYTEYFRIVEGVEALGYILRTGVDDE